MESKSDTIITRRDDAQLQKLRQLGMTSSEEAKLMAMRDYIMKLANAISSFATRLRPEDDAEPLKTISDVELQKLKVVPQTVFLKTRASELSSRAARTASARRATFDLTRSPILDTPRLSRPPSIDFGPSGAPFEDLRRRLSAINGSATSLPTNNRIEPHRIPSATSAITSPLALPSIPVGPALTDLPPVFDRPGSPTESVLSNTNSAAAFRGGMHRLHVGSTDGQKAAPAVGSSRANATGLLEPLSKLRSEGSPERSGRTSPVSAAGTVRGQTRHRLAPLVPISTYGQLCSSYYARH